MPVYKAPMADSLFILREVLQADAPLAGLQEIDDSLDLVLAEAAKLAEEEAAPLNQVGDRQGCQFDKGVVRTPDGFIDLYRLFSQAGWVGLTMEPDHGGQGLPNCLGKAVEEYFSAANMAFSMYPGLSQGAYHSLQAHGDAEQKALYLPKLASGVWTGTMNLTEPHCGTDLGLLRCAAEACDDGSYRITGTKIFISSGEHDLAENIVHLTLARMNGAPAGVKGISLFVVPKFLPNADGSLGARNEVSCGGLEEKMGIHGNATCVMNYDGARGWLVGAPHKGLRAMFTMMNHARLSVGLQGMAQADIASQNAVSYARERRQGRALDAPRDPTEAADCLIVHPDIRRILMELRAFTEGARAIVLWVGSLLDRVAEDQTTEKAKITQGKIDLITPIVKAFLTDYGFAATVQAQQVLGGHGYIREWGMDQFVRDSRIAMIYEGANGIHGLDLIGRKLPRQGGQAFRNLIGEIESFIADGRSDQEAMAALQPILDKLSAAVIDLQQATLWMARHGLGAPMRAAAGSMDYLHLFGLVIMGYMWARMAAIAIDKGDTKGGFYRAKMITAQFYCERILCKSSYHRAVVESGGESVLALAEDLF